MDTYWEYLVLTPKSLDLDNLQSELNQLGQDRWKLSAKIEERLVFTRPGETAGQPSRARRQPVTVQEKTPKKQMASDRDRTQLTAREMDVFQLVGQGLSNKQVASHLGLRDQSVKNLTSGILRKLGVENRTQLALKYLEMLDQTGM